MNDYKCIGCNLNECSFKKLYEIDECPCQLCLVKVMCKNICKSFILFYHKILNETLNKENRVEYRR